MGHTGRQPLPDLDGAVWLRRDALAQGHTDKQIRHLVRTGVWHRIRRGAYCARALWDELTAADRHRLLCRAVLRTAHPATVLSHVSAAVEHGIPVWGADLTVVHTTRRDGRAGRREAGIVHHRGALPEEHVDVVNGVPCTTVPRLVVEVCTISGVEEALVTANGALHSGLTTRDEVAALAHDTRYWPSSLTTRMVMGLSRDDLESPLESRLWYFFWSEHLPVPEPQVEVCDERGVVVARVDFAWPEEGVFLEADGRAKYELHRRPNESLESFLLREKRREELVCLLTGWTCVRVGWADLATPQLLARRLRAVLAGRRRPA